MKVQIRCYIETLQRPLPKGANRRGRRRRGRAWPKPPWVSGRAAGPSRHEGGRSLSPVPTRSPGLLAPRSRLEQAQLSCFMVSTPPTHAHTRVEPGP